MTGILNVLIAGYYGFKNAGDEAILRAIINDLRALHPGVCVTAVSGNPAGTSETYGISGISWHDSLGIFDAVSEADLTIVGGGGIFHDYWGFDPNLFLTDRQSGIAFYTAPAVLAGLLGKPLMLYAVGVGPLLSGHAKRFTRVACEAATAITVRDDGSKRLLESIGVAGDRITVTADPVFSLSLEQNHPGVAIDAFTPHGNGSEKAPGGGLGPPLGCRRGERFLGTRISGGTRSFSRDRGWYGPFCTVREVIRKAGKRPSCVGAGSIPDAPRR